MNFLAELNDVQRQAAENIDGPSLVIAGAGSGKTRVLTYRIAHLLSIGVPAREIMALTFTNKAAREMKERIARLTDDQTVRYLWMGTFHSIFARILRRESEALGYPSSFTIYDMDDSKSMIRTIIKDLKLDDQIYKTNDVLRRISSAKNNLISAEQYAAMAEIQSQDLSAKKPAITDIYKAYSTRCFKSGVMDFDDLLVKTNILLRDHSNILERYQKQFKYLLVDEYQDTNYAQYLIVKKLAELHNNICVVGDDSQSIYSFRGAKIENILNFRNDYPEYKIYKLEQNYRSTQNIVDAANSLIAKNKDRIPKEVWSEKEPGDKVKIIEAHTDQEEGYLIANGINQIRLQKRVDYNAFAILYRTNAQSRILEEACRKQNIPYRVFGSISFYQRKEIKDALAYFRLSVNLNDDESIRRVINYPTRGIGKTTLEKLSMSAFEAGVSLWSVLNDPESFSSKFNKGTLSKLAGFKTVISHFHKRQSGEEAFDLGQDILTKTSILQEFAYDRTPESLSKYENLQELLNGIREFAEDEKKHNPETEIHMEQYLENIALLTDQDTKAQDDKPKVSLMTIHASKGLEFPYVHIAGMEEELFPSQFSASSGKELQEERRLFYVALTRAMETVIISYAQTRYRWGSLVNCRRSRFIQEINSRFVDLPETSIIQKKPSRQDNRSNWKPSRNLVRIQEAKPNETNTPDFKPDSPDQMQAGMTVLYARFGEGKILKIEGDNPNRKATVFFKSSGQKQLLLKFAKLKILKQQ
ncbi:MAG: UvrD-helicase domain-containing protein [Bacteroidetes bacterium]|nr:UvrD-helicase domain-containing protein [Bacteroidota bacterium]MBT7463300.1 UvrD-helicase domain-containing protein [Bacteroidota bacterium]